MGCRTKIQLIKRQASEQWYVNLPAAIAQAMRFSKGEEVEWVIEDNAQLVLIRLEPPASIRKKKPHGQE